MKPALTFAAFGLVLVIGFAAGWMSRDAYKPTVHVVVDDIPFMSGSNLPQPKAPDCGTAAECMQAANCEILSFTDRKTHKLRYPKECADYFAKKHAAQASQQTPKPTPTQ